MGYRSEVMAAFYTTNKDEAPLLKLFIEENWPKEGNLTAYEWLKSDEYFGIIFHEEDVKWYESFPEVQAFDAFAEKFMEIANAESIDEKEQRKPDWFYEFVRIGEEYQDIETKGTYYSDNILSVSRAVLLNV